jgi:hypothetical protein
MDELELDDHVGTGVRGGIEDSDSGRFFEDHGLRKGDSDSGRFFEIPG